LKILNQLDKKGVNPDWTDTYSKEQLVLFLKVLHETWRTFMTLKVLKAVIKESIDEKDRYSSYLRRVDQISKVPVNLLVCHGPQHRVRDFIKIHVEEGAVYVDPSNNPAKYVYDDIFLNRDDVEQTPLPLDHFEEIIFVYCQINSIYSDIDRLLMNIYQLLKKGGNARLRPTEEVLEKLKGYADKFDYSREAIDDDDDEWLVLTKTS
jgi:hypothetical protein